MNTADEVKAFTEKFLKKKFVVAIITPVATQEEMMEHMLAHLEYMKAHEDKLFLSGPLVQPGVSVGEGLTVFKTDDEAQARVLMDAEPLTKLGLRRYELKTWSVYEGSLSLTISAVNSSVTIQ